MYTHPILKRDSTAPHSAIFNREELTFELLQGSTQGYAEVTYDLEEFLQRVKQSHQLRRSLGIPNFIYHAYSFPRIGYWVDHVRNIVEWARHHQNELRVWVNEESALLLLVIADPDTSENSGIKLYQYIQDDAPSYQSYGLSSWYEFCLFGVPVPNDWALFERNSKLWASSPDGQQIVVFGG